MSDLVRRTSAKACDVSTATVCVAVDTEFSLIGVTTFSNTAAERLLSTSNGVALAAVDTLDLDVRADRDGRDRRNWRLTSSRIRTARQAQRRRARECEASSLQEGCP